jgi:hypothetical protein
MNGRIFSSIWNQFDRYENREKSVVSLRGRYRDMAFDMGHVVGNTSMPQQKTGATSNTRWRSPSAGPEMTGRQTIG